MTAFMRKQPLAFCPYRVHNRVISLAECQVQCRTGLIGHLNALMHFKKLFSNLRVLLLIKSSPLFSQKQFKYLIHHPSLTKLRKRVVRTPVSFSGFSGSTL
jgi:hypothetical protein